MCHSIQRPPLADLQERRNDHFAQSPQAISPLQLFHTFGLCIPVIQQFAVAQLQNLNTSPRASSHPILLAPCLIAFFKLNAGITPTTIQLPGSERLES
jgi:hypothetical protein